MGAVAMYFQTCRFPANLSLTSAARDAAFASGGRPAKRQIRRRTATEAAVRGSKSTLTRITKVLAYPLFVPVPFVEWCGRLSSAQVVLSPV